ncbi:MAG: hypothetical protein KGJ01_00565 [Patescibacteria group bacterium]|nr:hypothetical protein [Patescibacteria group bacterium]
MSGGSPKINKIKKKHGIPDRLIVPPNVRDAIIKKELARLLENGAVSEARKAGKEEGKHGANYTVVGNDGRIHLLQIRISYSREKYIKRNNRRRPVPVIVVVAHPSTKSVRSILKSAIPSLRCARKLPS